MSIDEIPTRGTERAVHEIRAAASIEAPAIQVAPGERASGTLSVTNLTGAACTFELSLTGLEPEWYTLAEMVGPIEAGAHAEVPVEVSVPRGYPACTLLVSIEARPVYAEVPDDAPDAGRTDLDVVVGDSAAVGARMDPTEISGRRHGRFSLFVRNRSGDVQQVHVRGVSVDSGLRGRFSPTSALVAPGNETKVKGRVATRLRFFGEARRHPFAVHVDWRGTPVVAEGTFTSHPLLPSWASKAVVILLVVALWAAVAVVGIQALSHHLHHAAVQRTTLGQPHHQGTSSSTGTTSPSSPKTGGAPSSGAPGSKPSPGKTTSSGSTVEVAGKVTGSHPGGVTVSLAPTSLVATSILGASAPGAVLAAAFRARHGRSDAAPKHPPTQAPGALLVRSGARPAPLPDGKVYGTETMAALFPGLAASRSPTLTTRTNPGGSYVISGVVAPGTYLATFTEPGYNTKKFIVQTQKGKSVALSATMSPGTGTLSGVVRGPNGPLGGASVTITDGAITLTTVTPTVGSDVGRWSMSGLNTPDNYSVTASRSGYGTQITTARLAPSASIAGVNLHLVPGVASISGTVIAATSSQKLGGVTVSATNGSATAIATTSTVSPVGTYLLPNLVVPGTWTLTISGTGWLTETQRVKLRSNVVVNASLTSVGANVIGVVSSSAGGLANVGLTLKGSTTTYKALSASAAPVGGFDFAKILPGQYVLSATLFGYTTQSASVKVTSGETVTVDLTMPYIGASAVLAGSITGSVVNEFTAAPLATVPIDLDGQTTTVKTNSAGVYTISNVTPGLHQVTAMGASKTFANAGVQVSVAEGATVTAPAIELPHLTTIKGTVTSTATGKVVPTPTVKLLSHGSTVGSPVVITSASNGTYKITHVSPGTYTIQVTKKATDFNLKSVTVTVTAGETTVTVDVALTSGATFQVSTWTSQSGNLQLTPTVCVILSITKTGTKKTSTAQVTATNTVASENDQVTFSSLVSGTTYVVTFKLPKNKPTASGCLTLPTGTVTASLTTYTFTAKTSNATVYSAVLISLNRSVSVSLKYPYVTATNGGTSGTLDCPVRTGASTNCPSFTLNATTLPTVTLTGTTGYSSKTGGTPGGAQTGSITLKVTATHPGVWVPKTTAPVKFVGTRVTLKVTTSKGQFSGVTKSEELSSTGTTTLSVLLTPTPVAVSGTIAPATGVSITIAPGTLHATSTSTTTANTLATSDTISASEGTAGAITWFDSATGFSTGKAQPGVYTLTFKKTGYVTKSGQKVTISVCPPGTTGGSCSRALTPSSFTLASLVTLNVHATTSAARTTLTALTITLYKGSTSIATKTMSSSGTTYSATFASTLTPTATDYNYKITGQGIKQYLSRPLGTASSTFVVVPGNLGTLSSPTTTVTHALTELGWLTGKVTGILVPASTASGAKEVLPSAKITATDTTTPKCATLSATSNSTGIYRIVASTGGLCPGHTYDLTFSKSGFTLPATTLVATTGTNTKNLTATATKVTQKLTVSGVASGVVLTARATSTVGPALSCTVTVGAASPTCATATASVTPSTSGTSTVFTFSIDPTSYSYGLTAYQYQQVTIGSLSYTPGTTPNPQTYTMTQQLVTILGTVTVSATGGASGAKAIPGLKLSLETTSGTTTVATTTTGTSGTYKFSSVKPGNYKIVPGDNYTTLTTISISTGAATRVTKPFTVYALSRQVTITVNGTKTHLPSGAKVRLKPTTGTLSTASCGSDKLLETGLGKTYTATPSSSTSFSSVIPDFYKVSVGGTTAPTAFTLLVCPSTSTTAKTKPTTPAVTVPSVTLSPTSLSVTYGSETAATKSFTVTVTGTHGYPTGSVKLTVGGTSSTPSCGTPVDTTHSHTYVATFTCHLTGTELIAGTHSTVRVIFTPKTGSSSSTTSHFYVTNTATMTITVAKSTQTPTFTLTTPTVTVTYGAENAATSFVVHVIGTTGDGYPIAKTNKVTLKLAPTPTGTATTLSCPKTAAATVTTTFTCPKLTTKQLAAGKFKVSAKYTPATPTSSSISNYSYRTSTSSTKTFTVLKKYLTPTVTVTAPSLTYGTETNASFTVTVTGTSGDGYPIGKVTVKTTTTKLCTSTTPSPTPPTTPTTVFKCHLSATQLAANTYSKVKATYTPGSSSSSNTNYAYNTKTSTPAVTLTVAKASVTTASVALVVNKSTVHYGAETTVTFETTVTGTATDGHPLGTVTVKTGATTLCSTSSTTTTSTASPPTTVFKCKLTARQLTVGTYSSIKTTYTPGSSSSSNTNYKYTLKTSTPAQSLAVTKATQAALTLTSTSGTHGTALTLTTSGGSDSGTVSYVVDSAGTAGCALTSGTKLTATSAGTCTVTATMAGSANYNAVSSTPTTVTFG